MGYDAPYPEFSWSHSRDRTLAECARAYFWRYYGGHRGWSPEAPEEARLAYALKQLTSFPMIVGTAVHDCARECTEAVRRGTSHPSFDTMLIRVSEALNRAVLGSHHRGLFQRDPKRISMLHDAWYSGRSSSAGLAAAVAKARVCLRTLETSRVWEDLEACSPEWITVPEGPEAFVHEGWPIYAGPDLVYRPDERRVVILDWKTGDDSDADLQIALYALYCRTVLGLPFRDDEWFGRVVPARAPNAITVGATNSSDARATFSTWGSNFGTCLDLFAPGVDVTSAWYTSTTATNTICGTSMASPHVAGVAALYLQGSKGASPATVASAILDNATLNKVTNAGTGSPNRLLYSLFPVKAKVTGTDSINSAGTYTWQANPSGGTGTYTYAWEYRVQGSTTWTPVTGGASYSRTVATSDADFQLRVTVTSGGLTDSDKYLVSVTPPGPPVPTITGPSVVGAGTHVWNVTSTGGDGTYSYAWEYRVQGGTWAAAGTGTSYSRTVAATDPAFELRVTATSAGLTGSDTQLVAVSNAPTANITGRTLIFEEGTYTWYANAAGGNGTYTYQWQARVDGGTWSNVGTTSYYSRQFSNADSETLELKVTVTSNGLTGFDTYDVNVQIQDCGEFLC